MLMVPKKFELSGQYEILVVPHDEGEPVRRIWKGECLARAVIALRSRIKAMPVEEREKVIFFLREIKEASR